MRAQTDAILSDRSTFAACTLAGLVAAEGAMNPVTVKAFEERYLGKR